MANEDMWDRLFEGVNSLKTRLEPTETDARDAFVLAVYGFCSSLLIEMIDHPNNARRLKDGIIKQLRRTNLSQKRIELMSSVLTEFCDRVEQTP
jgi:hypothetical protein